MKQHLFHLLLLTSATLLSQKDIRDIAPAKNVCDIALIKKAAAAEFMKQHRFHLHTSATLLSQKDIRDIAPAKNVCDIALIKKLLLQNS